MEARYWDNYGKCYAESRAMEHTMTLEFRAPPPKVLGTSVVRDQDEAACIGEKRNYQESILNVIYY